MNVTYYERSELRATDRPYSMGDPERPNGRTRCQCRPAALFPAPFATPTLSSGAGNPATSARSRRRWARLRTARSELRLRTQRVSARRRVQLPVHAVLPLRLPGERLNVYSTMEHDFSDHVTAFGEVGYMRVDIENTISPSYVLNKKIVPLDHPDIPGVARRHRAGEGERRSDGQEAKLRFGPVGSRTRGGDYRR